MPPERDEAGRFTSSKQQERARDERGRFVSKKTVAYARKVVRENRKLSQQMTAQMKAMKEMEEKYKGVISTAGKLAAVNRRITDEYRKQSAEVAKQGRGIRGVVSKLTSLKGLLVGGAVALHLHSPVSLHRIWQGSPAWS